MHHILFADKEKFHTAILIKKTGLVKEKLQKYYIDEMTGVSEDDIIAFSLKYDGKKIKAVDARAYLDNLLKVLENLEVKNLIVADPLYFKLLTKKVNTEKEHGYINKCVHKGYEHMKVILVPNHQATFHNPNIVERINLDIKAYSDMVGGSYKKLGANVLHCGSYITETDSFKTELDRLHQYDELTCDIEGFGLKHYACGIATIAFAWDEHNGICFSLEYSSGSHIRNFVINRKKQMLREFLENYKGKLIFHNATFDIKVIIYTLWMKTLLDQEGLIEGLNIMTRNIACTKIITYLATNTTAGNKLGLKYQSHEYAGNYGEDVTDIRNLTLGNLMKYNIMDCICTWYVHNKHWPTLVADNQERVYNEIMIKSIKVIVQMELTGACVDMGKVLDAEKKLEKEMSLCSIGINMHPIVQDVIKYKKAEQLLVDNAKLKTKERQWDELGHIDFNPNSSKDLQILFHEVLDYPVIDRTPTKMPATGAKTINKHIGALMDEVHRGLFESLVGVAQISIILNNFIKNFKEARLGEDGMHYLFGNFNLGGTVSGRLSSSQPNMQNIPSTGSKYAKMIKECFVAPEGWIFCGADFASLEDRISALLTKDTNKLKVYTDGFDGHAYRAYHYYPSEYVGISLTPESINGTVKTHKKWRQKSKTPTFLLTYGGTYIGIMEQTGMTMIEAKTIEANYHTLYAESDAWVQEQVKEASNTGYVECAFGLRVRTPILKQTLFNTQVTPYEAMKEGRTAGNALGQSWGMLNNRAAIALQETVLASEFALDIRPSMHIHDAQYFLVRDELDVVEFLNNELGKEMSWQDDPKIQHDVVSLSGDLDLFHPHWGESVTLPNYAKPLEIEDLVESHLSKLSGSNKVS